MTTQPIEVSNAETFLAALEEQERRARFGQAVPQIAIAPEEGGGGDGGFLDFLTRSFISEGVLDTIRDQGLFGRIGANVLGELTNPIGIASTALLATGVGAPIGAGLRAATAGTRGLSLLGRAGQAVLTPVSVSARAAGPSGIIRSPALLGRSLAAEAGVAGGAIAGGGLAQETGQLIPGPTRSVPGQVALGLGGGLAGGGLSAGAFNRVLDEQAAIRTAVERANPIEEQVPGLAAIRKNFQQVRATNKQIEGEVQQLHTRQAELGVEAEGRFPDDPFRAAGAARVAGAGETVTRQRFDPLAVSDEVIGGIPQLRDVTEAGRAAGITTDTFRQVGERANDVYSLDFFRRNNAKEAFAKMMLGEVPTPAERDLLRPVVGDAFIDQVETVIGGRGRRGFQLMVDVVGLPRGLMASFDASSLLRQGGLLTASHPKKTFWGKDSAVGTALKAVRDPEFARVRNQQMFADADFVELNKGLDRQDQLFLHQLDGPTDTTRREEVWVSGLLQKIPGVGASERFFATHLNEMRFALAKQRLATLREQYPEVLSDPQRYQQWKVRNNRALNAFTGRGSLGFIESPGGDRAQQVRNIRDLMSISFWSPRLLVSRLQSVQEAIRAGRGSVSAEDPAIRALSREIARDVAIYAGGVTAVITGLSFLPGVSVETNPKSSDFGKVRVGDTRFDPWAGFQQIGRYATQFITGERKRTTDGTINDVQRDRILGQFLRSKLAPGIPSLTASDLPRDFVLSGLTGDGKNFIGEPITGTDVTPGAGARVVSAGQIEQLPAEINVLIDQMVPLLAQDIVEAMETDGLLAGAGSGAGAFFGLSTSSYGENTRSVAVNDQRQTEANAGSRERQVANAAFR